MVAREDHADQVCGEQAVADLLRSAISLPPAPVFTSSLAVPHGSWLAMLRSTSEPISSQRAPAVAAWPEVWADRPPSACEAARGAGAAPDLA